MLRSFHAGYKPLSIRPGQGLAWPAFLCCNMRMSRALSRLIAGCILAIALLAMWELYYHISIDNAAAKENLIRPLSQVRTNVQLNKNIREKTEAEIEKSKSDHIDFMKKQKEIQLNRKRTLQDACAKVPPDKDIPEYTKRHIYVVDQFKIAYCFVPKVGCSNWKRVLMVLNGDRDSVEDLTSNEVHLHAKMKFLHQYKPEDRERILKDYYWFFFVREPFNRALSVYRNKFEDYEYYLGNKYFHKFGKEIVKKWRKNPSAGALESGANVTWPEFVDYLTHPAERENIEKKDWHFSDHWREMYKICSPCTINYDFIGKLETVETDAKYILKSWGVEDKVSYLSSQTSRPTNSSSHETYDKYFGKIGKDKITKLWDLYKGDFELFNYTKPEIVS